MIRYFCNVCDEVEFDESQLQWYEKNGDEPIFCRDCEKLRCLENDEEFIETKRDIY